MFEQKLQEFFAAGEIPGFVHLYLGEEAVATGACAALTDKDAITSTHRGHGHLLAKGGDLKLMMAEIFGRKTGYCKGKGGSMHIADMDLGILGANGIVGGGGPLAVGAALAAQYKKTDNVALCFFGDGASNQGTTQESLNWASAWKLPLVFVNENNGYGISCPQCKSMAITDIADRAAAYDMPGVVVDGNDVLAVHEAVLEAVKRARKGEGPSLIECKTYRWRGHLRRGRLHLPLHRRAGSLAGQGSPFPVLRKSSSKARPLPRKRSEKIKADIAKAVDEAVAYAKESPCLRPANCWTTCTRNIS